MVSKVRPVNSNKDRELNKTWPDHSSFQQATWNRQKLNCRDILVAFVRAYNQIQVHSYQVRKDVFYDLVQLFKTWGC
jgi:hypothetical protein